MAVRFINLRKKERYLKTMSNKNIYLKFGKTLIEEGAQEENPSAFIIEDGSMSVHIAGNHICDLSKGSIVGEMSLITGQPRSATVTSISENCVVREITANEFKLLWQAKPEALLPVLKMVTERLSSTMQMIENLQKTLRNGNGV